MKVLLVDDSSTMRRIQKNVLSKSGHTDVIEAADGISAQIKLESGEVDLILLDWNMPNMDGLTFLKTIREQGVSTPVIMVTTEGQKENILTALQSGANSYVVKPFTPDVLTKRIDDVMAKVNA
ncbi:MAG: response regulator [Planctomycetes bacterium]|jgi:two-component system chemotaxis response regulator CheY|nr:response regulator [Planctomycetota bacterium]